MPIDTQPPPPRRKVSIAIVGAGVAGLRAAEVLLNANNKENGDANVEYHVTVFEARSRIGGRVLTSDGIEGWTGVGKTVDLGPNWIHGTHENPLTPFLPLTTPPSVVFDPYVSGAGLLHIHAPRGPKILGKDVADGVFTQVMLAIVRAEEYSRRFGKKVDGRWSLRDYLWVAAEVKYGVSVPRDLGAEHGDGEWEKERVRVREFEKGFMVEEVNEGMVRKIIGGSGSEDCSRDIGTTMPTEEKAIFFMQMAEFWGAWVGEPLGEQSLRWLIMEEGMEGDQHFLASTYAPVLDLLSKPLLSGISEGKSTLHLNTQVTHIDLAANGQSSPQIAITTSLASPSTSSTNHTTTSIFSAALLCLPLGVLKHSHHTLFPPFPSPLSLPPRALSAINNLGYGRLEKVYLRFDRAWWPHDARAISFLEDGNIKEVSTTSNPTNIPPQTQMTVISLSSLPPPHAQPTLLFYLYGETSAALLRALDSLSSSTTSSSPETKMTAPPPDSPHFALLTAFFYPYIARLHHSLSLTHPSESQTQTPPPAPTQILHTTHTTSPFSGYGSYTYFPTHAEDSESDVHVLQTLGGIPEGSESGWPCLPLWLCGEHVSPRKGLGTVAGAWWSGGEKAGRVRQWFEGGQEQHARNR
ncbi:hypothetical protein EV426DRAFT_709517 [Tirmania nivea]|nr:hypothetical protein EV426DRAFT_709517 [Tirmania nivea]